MKRLIISGVMFLALFFTANSYAQQDPPDEGLSDERPRHEKMMDKLNLTEQQQDQISKLRSEHQLKMIDTRAQIQKLEVQLKDEKNKTDLNKDNILSLTKQIGDLRTQMQTERTQMWLNMYNLLDDKQKALWKEHQPEGFGERMMRPGRMKERMKLRHMEEE